MVHIAESRVGRKYGEWFLRQGVRMHQTLQHIKSKPLPIVDEKAHAAHAAAVAAAAAGNPTQNVEGNKSSRSNQQNRTGGGAGKGVWGAPRANAAVLAAAGSQPNGAAVTTA